MINKENYDLIIMWSEHFEILNQLKSNNRYLCVIAINNIIAIIVKNSEKIFVKNKKVFWTINDLKKRLSEYYHNRMKIFNFEIINKLLLYRKIDYNIDLQSKFIFLTKKIYRLSREQILIIKTYIDNMRQKNFIKHNFSL